MAGRLKVYLHSNAIIRFAESDDAGLRELCFGASERGIDLVTSELSLAEALVVPLRENDQELVGAYTPLLQSDDFMAVIPVTRDILIRCAEIRASIGGKTPDAIHCATAELAGCGIVVSSDRRLRLPENMTRIDLEDAGRVGAGS